MLATIKDNHWIWLDQVTPGAEDVIIKEFSVRDPKAFFIDTGRDWDGYYRRFDRKNQRLALPFLNKLIKCCETHDVPLEIQDIRLPSKFPAPQESQITDSLLNGIVAEPYQVGAWKVICKEEIGLVSATTGAGKTEIMAGIIQLFRCPTTVITESTVVLHQIVKRLQLYEVVHNDDIGLFCSGHLPNNNLVIVGNIQSISSPTRPKREDVRLNNFQMLKRLMTMVEKRNIKCYDFLPHPLVEALFENPLGIEKLANHGKYLQRIHDYMVETEYLRRTQWYQTRLMHAKQIQDQVRNSDLLLVDEADLATKPQYTILFKRIFNGRRKYGVTGTVCSDDKPVQNLLLEENLGSVIYETQREEVQARGRIIPVQCTFISVGSPENRKDCRAYDIAMKEDIVENNEFHQLVVKINGYFAQEGNLILLDTTPIEPLGKTLESIIPNSKFLYNKSSQRERDENVKLFEERKLQCLIAGRIFKRGLDLAGGCENLIVIGGGRQDSNITQMIGRAVRINKRGWARIFCFYHLNNKYLYDHSRQNLKAVVNMGYPTTILLNRKQIDGREFIRTKFRIPR